ncbi:MAG TPA: CPBP family glutamic-type intramembrane protease [Acidimicrobiia bacterium]|nr:CPBP family glutamic-type intramembrane protease [Acidimicrobiia bacterium]
MMRRPVGTGSRPKRASRIPISGFIWVGFLVASLLLMYIDPVIWAIGVTASAAILALVLSSSGPPWHPSIDRRDLIAVALFYGGVVGLFRVAFVVFTPDRPVGFWLTVGAGMLLGVVGPISQQVGGRRRGLSSLGITRHHLAEALTLGLILAIAQFGAMIWGHQFGELVDWMPLLAFSLVVGFFEVFFFRGFIQTRLEASLGTGPSVAGAAVLYAIYHLGYGVGPEELWLLFGLGLVYAVAYRLVENIFVLWPVVTPLNLFFNVEAIDIDLPWSSMVTIAAIGVTMIAATLWAHRHIKRRYASLVPAPSPGTSPFDESD